MRFSANKARGRASMPAELACCGCSQAAQTSWVIEHDWHGRWPSLLLVAQAYEGLHACLSKSKFSPIHQKSAIPICILQPYHTSEFSLVIGLKSYMEEIIMTLLHLSPASLVSWHSHARPMVEKRLLLWKQLGTKR